MYSFSCIRSSGLVSYLIITFAFALAQPVPLTASRHQPSLSVVGQDLSFGVLIAPRLALNVLTCHIDRDM